MSSRPFRQCAAWLSGVAVLALLWGCGSGETAAVPGLSRGAHFVGGVAADEPRAALAARDVLAAGGSAADAAVALTFTLAVTYPSRASLGGGGQCLVYAPGAEGDAVETLDFLPARSAIPAPAGGAATAVPGMVRGMYALHARYGRLRWSRLLAPAEALARFGHPASRALARDAAAAAGGASGAGALLASGGGAPIAEGRALRQPALAGTLTWLRLAGPGDFHDGRLARAFAQAVTGAGGTLDTSELRRYRPRWRGTAALPFESHELHTTPDGAAAEVALRRRAGAAYGDATEAERLSLLADAAAGATQGTTGTAPTTSFVAADRQGMAVVCGLTTGGLFGAGRRAPGTGIVLAAPPERPFPFALALLVNHVNGQLFLAAGAGGGEAAPSALAATLLELLDAERPLRAALAAPRVHVGGSDGRVAVESAVGAAARRALEARGHRLMDAPALGRVNAIHCPGGLPRNPGTCRIESDRRGFGTAAGGLS